MPPMILLLIRWTSIATSLVRRVARVRRRRLYLLYPRDCILASIGLSKGIDDADFNTWFECCVKRGFTVPSWPIEYGGAGLSSDEVKILTEEMRLIRAPVAPVGMATAMIGPTLLELGDDDQKARHLPGIASGETMTFATSMFKYYSTELLTAEDELRLKAMGTLSLGWEGEEFSSRETAATRNWLENKALTNAQLLVV